MLSNQIVAAMDFSRHRKTPQPLILIDEAYFLGIPSKLTGNIL